MTVDQYIALGASIGACLSAVFAAWTILVLVRQQRAAYRPAFALSRAMIRSMSSGDLPVPRMWTDESSDSVVALTAHRESGRTAKSEDHAGRLLFMNVRNIGLGSANNIHIRWTFPMKGAVQKVNEIAQDASALSFAHGRVHVSLSDESVLHVGWRHHQQEFIDYITTSPSKGRPFALAVPYAYAVVASAMIFYYEQSSKAQYLTIPILRLDLTYRDIGQHRHRASFDIHFNPACTDPSSGELIYGFLEHKRRKRSRLFDWAHRFIHGHVILPSSYSARISDTSARSFQSTEA